ncbi:GNAT family N-acetyltransferase [Nocardiopsis synnemataformans]|uniref:GNAT family N-acetyltransferase n=1 Tax=Nocardiopsis synnemataformans TaxID=61305 RepID=UPI003EB80A71
MPGPRDTSRLVLPFPYVPTLGPVHPDALTAHLWDEVMEVNGTGSFLAHDKDARWGGTKNETVLADAIRDEGETVTVPTLARRGRGVVKVHYYGRMPDVAQALEEAGKLAAEHGAGTARVLWFSTEADTRWHSCRVQLKTFTGNEPRAHGRVGSLEAEALPVQDTFVTFANALKEDGFVFLAERMRTTGLDGPLFVAVTEGRVVGAIGPMAIRRDSLGALRLLPQYFGVLPEARGHGHGRVLWRAAMRWGQENGAAYQLLQTETGGASDHLCRSEGLTSLGFVFTASP